MAKYDIYEKDGAVFRKPSERKHGIVDDVQVDGEWRPYRGDRMAPVSFGTFLRTEDGEPAAKAQALAAE
jgi:hypothetical protein